MSLYKTLHVTIVSSIIFAASSAFAAPDITVTSLSVPASAAPGSVVTISGQVTNQGTEMDISNSYRPVKVGGIDLQNSPTKEMVGGGQYSYVSVGSSPDFAPYDDIAILNSSNPLSPSKTWGSYLTTHSLGYPLAISSNRMYVAQNGYINVYDISNPASAQYLGQTARQTAFDYPTNPVQHPYDIAAYGSYAYSVDPQNRIRIINASNPSAPASSHYSAICMNEYVLSGQSVTACPGTQSFWSPVSVFVDGGYLYVTYRDTAQWGYDSSCGCYRYLSYKDTHEFVVFSLSNSASPTLVGLSPNWPIDMNSIACSTPPASSCSAPRQVSPQPAGSVYPGVRPTSLANNRIFAGRNGVNSSATGNMYVVNVANKSNPYQEAAPAASPSGSSLVRGAFTTASYTTGNYIYAATSRGLSIFDAASPASSILKSFDIGYGWITPNSNSNFNGIDITFPNKYYVNVLGGDTVTGYEMIVLEPHTFVRLCRDNASCINSTTNRIDFSSDYDKKDFDAGRLSGGASRAFTTTWTAPSTAGTYTIYACSDVFGGLYTETNPKYDGVAESNESNNCASAQIVVGNLTPPTAWINDSIDPTVVNQTFTVTWGSTNAASCQVDKRNDGGTGTWGSWNAWGATNNPSGTQDAAPAVAGQHEWRNVCTGPGGTATGYMMHTVNCAPGYTLSGGTCVQNTYSCGGTRPVNTTMCAGDVTNGLTSPANYTRVAGSGSCSVAQCEYYCSAGYTWNGSGCVPITYSCGGTLPANTTMCAGDSTTGLTSPANYTRVAGSASCSVPQSAVQCEYYCSSTYSWNGSGCVRPDLSATNVNPTSGNLSRANAALTFTGTARNSNTLAVAQGGWAGVEIDWGSDGSFTYYAAPDDTTQLGSFALGEVKQISRSVTPTAVGTHRYRFNVDSTGQLLESDEANNQSFWTSFRVIDGTLTVNENDAVDDNRVDYNTTVNVSWSTQGTSGLSCSVTRTTGSVWSGTTGSQPDTLTSGPVTYTLGCTNGTQTVILASETIEVDVDADLRVEPRIINAGETVDLIYDTQGQTCTITGGGQTYTVNSNGDGDPDADRQTSTPINGTTTFTIDCPLGADDTATVEVRVSNEER